jgi:hypothetical protein
VFRFNRRRSRSRGLVFYRVLELAIAHEPVHYRDLIANPEPRARLPMPPATRGHPASLERPPSNRPWRTPTYLTPVRWIAKTRRERRDVSRELPVTRESALARRGWHACVRACAASAEIT